LYSNNGYFYFFYMRLPCYDFQLSRVKCALCNSYCTVKLASKLDLNLDFYLAQNDSKRLIIAVILHLHHIMMTMSWK